MNGDELSRNLAERRAVVVHFSHHANMREGGVFPDDMHAAITNKDKWPLSCSVLWPGHGLQPCGSVGVIFRPSASSVLSVSNTDSGSWKPPDGEDQSGGEPLTLDNFDKTFRVVGPYNEWRLRGANGAGIFVHNRSHILAKKRQHVTGLPCGEVLEEIGCMQIELSEVFNSFPKLSVFTFGPHGIVEVPRTH